MYRSHELTGGRTSKLSDDLIREIVQSPDLRPAISTEAMQAFELKRQRLSPGYAPTTARDLLDWLGERLILPKSEFDDLVAAIQRDGGDIDAIVADCGRKLVWLNTSGPRQPLVATLDNLSRVIAGLCPEPTTVTVTVVGDCSPVAANEWDAGAEPAQEETTTADELLEWVVSGWLPYHESRSAEDAAAILGVGAARLHHCLEDLAEAGMVVLGSGFVDGGEEVECVCDRDNLEALLRLARAQAVPVFEPLDLDALPLFLAAWQGLTENGDPGSPADRIEQLLCFESPASLWESEILPARLRSYSTTSMDALMQESPLRWVGRGEGRICFCFEPDLDLLDISDDGEAPAGEIPGLFADPNARYDFRTLQRSSGLSGETLSKALWSAVWQGRLTNDTMSALHKRVATGFQVPRVVEEVDATTAAERLPGTRIRRRGSFARWKGSLPFAGNWHLLPRAEQADDPVEVEERNKDRVRLLLDRYGLLFRELLQRELEPFRWASLFLSLRLMELSDEILSGCFFSGIPGPQFVSHRAFRLLQRSLPDEHVFWLNACDPISPCGLPLEALRGVFPRRVPSNHVVFHGQRLVLVSERNGRSLRFEVEATDPNLTRYLDILDHLLSRPFQSARQLTIDSINGEEAGRSSCVDALRTCFEVRVVHAELVIYRQ